MESIEKLKNSLISLFPSFAEELVEDEPGEFEYREELSLHHIWRCFSYTASKELVQAEVKVIKSLAELVNKSVAAGGVEENAVSTCFLEHASQIGVKKALKPHLSQLARQELR
ncbi:DUF7674 family protein [Simiduia agarivorans]|uniref:Uncharacterized protein n=1 Tax=Simiduia agarivorans (strain DSM 21679 / JCM 13881 / BCRC 17597 / SA1) TaxID=1117647 RepID=K4KKU1_SIMAS|nr:hypothetical protein [Simiduia agarivorans]AFU99764.1 hypothetical protein M5M_13090 [Simiduia agarivorans SA1 = DSM 21679]